MLAEITGMGQGSITVELQMIPRKGESVKIMYGPDAELEGRLFRLIIILINMPISIRYKSKSSLSTFLLPPEQIEIIKKRSLIGAL